ncbi:MAG TPA: hypothetical protein VGM06_21905 [Polyangiaceae bacterium]
MGTTFVLGAALCAGMVCVSRDAHALGPVDLEVGARVGGGTSPFGGQPSPLGFGLGGRAGASFLGYYGGLSLMYYLGASSNATAPTTPPSTVSTSEHAFLYGVEVGYGTKLLDLITLRGTLGVGNFSLSYTGFGNTTLNNLYLEPCLTGFLSFGILYVGADISLIVLPSIGDPTTAGGNSSWDTAFTAHGQIGVTF